jgi:hypothetical protein
MIISKDEEKNLWQNSASLYEKNLEGSRNKIFIPEHNKWYLWPYKPTLWQIGKNSKLFPLNSGSRHHNVWIFFINCNVWVLSLAIRQEREIKCIWIDRGEGKIISICRLYHFVLKRSYTY